MMRITAYCGGCDATADAGYVRQKFVSFSGGDHGFGKHYEEIEWALPADWVRFDMIGATYCPECASELWPQEKESSHG